MKKDEKLTRKPIDQVILDITAQNRVRDQRKMLDHLEERGFAINQSTLSRHLKKLNIRKLDGYYRLVPESKAIADTTQVTKVVAVPPNLLVIKTLPGHANAVSWHLDERGFEGIVGTVAGDDTVFIAIDTAEHLERVRKAISNTYGV